MNGIERINTNDALPADASVSGGDVYTTPGMPPLDTQGRTTSFFEFWPAWLVYIPIVLQWLAYSLRYRSLTLPLLANPTIPLSGMAGVAKSEILAQAKGISDKHILPWFIHRCSDDAPAEQLRVIDAQLAANDIAYPFVCKPDIGCRGVGVKRIADGDELQAYIREYPSGASFMVQKMSDWEPEAGIFYVRKPGASTGEVISFGLKYMPYVVGDGHSTVRQLLDRDDRIKKLMHLYASRHQDRFADILPAGEAYRLVFAASHSRGAIFRDGQKYASAELQQRLDAVLEGLPGFYYGRLDIKFRDIDELACGEGPIDIVEINTASSEPLHIWDRSASYIDAMRALLYQYKLMWQIGEANRERGYAPPPLLALLKGWRKEMQLSSAYPEND